MSLKDLKVHKVFKTHEVPNNGEAQYYRRSPITRSKNK